MFFWEKHCFSEKSSVLTVFFFSNRVIVWWNSLPEEVVTAPSVDSFKACLDKHFENHPVVYNYRAPDHPCKPEMTVKWRIQERLNLEFYPYRAEILYSTLLHSTPLYSAVLYSTLLFTPTLLCCTELHCTLLHCTALHCTYIPSDTGLDFKRTFRPPEQNNRAELYRPTGLWLEQKWHSGRDAWTRHVSDSAVRHHSGWQATDGLRRQNTPAQPSAHITNNSQLDQVLSRLILQAFTYQSGHQTNPLFDFHDL